MQKVNVLVVCGIAAEEIAFLKQLLNVLVQNVTYFLKHDVTSFVLNKNKT